MSKLLHSGRHLLYSTEIAAKIGRNEAICFSYTNGTAFCYCRSQVLPGVLRIVLTKTKLSNFLGFT
jgi:hypothetical protein